MLEERRDTINKKKDRISNGLEVIFTGLTRMKICDINTYLKLMIYLLHVEFRAIVYKTCIQ
jgi:hypothetical protein